MHVGWHLLNQREFNKDLYRSDTVKMHKVTKETKKNFGTRHKWIHDWLHIVHNEPLYIKGTSAEMALTRTPLSNNRKGCQNFCSIGMVSTCETLSLQNLITIRSVIYRGFQRRELYSYVHSPCCNTAVQPHSWNPWHFLPSCHSQPFLLQICPLFTKI